MEGLDPPTRINAAMGNLRCGEEGGDTLTSYEELMIVFTVLMIVVTLIIALIGTKK